ncbi:MAG: A/G-specific adenine glycosylase, partial [Traorella sp.]
MEIQEELIRWFKDYHRELPFRKSKDPYSIWVSEIMAQQTRIETMIPYYKKWMIDYPTIQDLTNAPIEKVLKNWEGLGYYNRARKLHEGAKQVVCEYQGQLPDVLDELLKISGIGPYTAGAIASIAYKKRTPAVDGNVLRVISRLFELDEDITKQKTKQKVYDIVYDLMENSDYGDFTEGLMELGALICMPQVILCNQCPLNHKCLSFQHHTQMNYPIKTKAKKNPIYKYKTLFIQKGNQILLSKD